MRLTLPFLQHINELTMKLSVEDVLTRAEALYRQLTACPVSPLLFIGNKPPWLFPPGPPHPPPFDSTPTHHLAFWMLFPFPPGTATQCAGSPGVGEA